MDPSAATECSQTQRVGCTTEHNDAAVTHSRVEKNRHGWRRIVLNFTPSWFSVNMGTGIVSILLHNLPYNGEWLRWISIILFVLNSAIFLCFLAISVLRYTLFRGLWGCMIKHPVQSLFLGTFPMGLATIINMIVFVCVPAWGTRAAILAWVLWCIDALLALATNFYMPFVIMYKHETQLKGMTAAWLLPVVATIVASASGAIVAKVMPNDQIALWTIITSYILWGCGMSMAIFVLSIYFQRLTMHALPPREVIVSVFLPLGPFGQGSFAVMQLGSDALTIFPRTHSVPSAPLAGQMLYTSGLFLALMLWGAGAVWLFFALASISSTKFPFNLGWWGFTFPLGVFAVATTTIAKELPSLFFKVLGTIMSLIVVLLWIVVSLRTLKRSWSGVLFVAPCLKDWEEQQRENRQAV